MTPDHDNPPLWRLLPDGDSDGDGAPGPLVGLAWPDADAFGRHTRHDGCDCGTPTSRPCPWCGGTKGWHEATCRRGIEPRPKSKDGRIFRYVRLNPCSTSRDVVEDLHYGLDDASTRLREMYERGLLVRSKATKAVRNGRASGRSTVYVYTVACRPGGVRG